MSNACFQPARPDVVNALRKRYPNLQGDDGEVIQDCDHNHEVIFYLPQSHMSCRLELDPIRFGHCHPIHA